MKAPTLWKIAAKFDTGFNIEILISNVMYCATLLVAFWPAAAAAAAGLATEFAQARNEILTAAAKEHKAKKVPAICEIRLLTPFLIRMSATPSIMVANGSSSASAMYAPAFRKRLACVTTIMLAPMLLWVYFLGFTRTRILPNIRSSWP